MINNVMRTLGVKELPENLSLLPLYMLGLLKNRVCCKDDIGNKQDYDLSNFLRVKLLKLNQYEVLSFVNPKIYALHHMLDNKEIGESDNNGVVNLPKVI